MIKQLIQIAYSNLSVGTLLSDQMPEVYIEVDKKVVSGEEQVEAISYGSLAAACIDKQLLLSVPQTQLKVYSVIPLLLLTVAAIVNGAESCGAIANWGHRNEELLRYCGLPEGKFPSHFTLRAIYAKLDIDSFEGILGKWLRETFSSSQDETNEMKAHTENIRIPGLRLLWPYQPIASAVVAKLR
jgi:hypothetical protein